jgi:hypothetical protein
MQKYTAVPRIDKAFKKENYVLSDVAAVFMPEARIYIA